MHAIVCRPLVLHMAAMDLKKVVTQQVGKASSHVDGHWISLHDSRSPWG